MGEWKIIKMRYVVPLVGTWIEMKQESYGNIKICVVPLVGTWIEIFVFIHARSCTVGRSPRGNVD